MKTIALAAILMLPASSEARFIHKPSKKATGVFLAQVGAGLLAARHSVQPTNVQPTGYQAISTTCKFDCRLRGAK